jgi:hypothetical protein
MALLGPSTDYTDKDFDALRVRIRNLIEVTFPNWTDDRTANFGNLLVELFCFVGDVLNKYQDNQSAEAYIGRASQRKNMLALIKLIDYVAQGNTAATVDLTINVLSGAPAADVIIPARTTFRTQNIVDPVIFESLDELVIPAGQVGPFTLTAENATLKTELFTASTTPSQEFVLVGTPYLDDSAVVIAANGPYTQVDNFLESAAGDLHYTVTVDQNDRATIRFGDNRNGAIPSGTISATYKIGGGTSGRVEPNTVVKMDSLVFDDFGNVVRLGITNASASTEADDRQTIEELRVEAPQSLRVLTRTVSREDYEINAKRVPGVARALMLTSNEDGIPENYGTLYIVPTGGGVPTQDLRDAVLEMVTVTYPNTLTFSVSVSNPIYLTVDVQAIVFLSQGANAATVRAAIIDNLEAQFAIDLPDGSPNGEIDFGYNLQDANGDPIGSIAWSDVLNTIRDTTGVKKVDAGAEGLLLNGVRDDLNIAVREFPILGTVTLINGETLSPL